MLHQDYVLQNDEGTGTYENDLVHSQLDVQEEIAAKQDPIRARRVSLAVMVTIILVLVGLGAGLVAWEAVRASRNKSDEAIDAESIVTTADGVVIGRRQANSNLVSFRGIPYALPPLGILRFQPPSPVADWKGILNATSFQPSCPRLMPGETWDDDTLPAGYSEDCLYLNIWIPYQRKKRAKLSVLVWFDGDDPSLDHGNGPVDWAPHGFGGQLASQGEVVVVTVGYRRDVFGRLASDLNPYGGLLSVQDQVLALDWISENIQDFGGDSDEITIGGQSEGAVTACVHLMSVISSDYRRVILQDGACTAPGSILPHAEAIQRGQAVLDSLGITTRDELQEASAASLLRGSLEHWGPMGWPLSADTRILYTPPVQLDPLPTPANVPLLLSWGAHASPTLNPDFFPASKLPATEAALHAKWLEALTSTANKSTLEPDVLHAIAGFETNLYSIAEFSDSPSIAYQQAHADCCVICPLRDLASLAEFSPIVRQHSHAAEFSARKGGMGEQLTYIFGVAPSFDKTYSLSSTMQHLWSTYIKAAEGDPQPTLPQETPSTVKWSDFDHKGATARFTNEAMTMFAPSALQLQRCVFWTTWEDSKALQHFCQLQNSSDAPLPQP